MNGFRERVVMQAAIMLDFYAPGWERRVDVNILDMMSIDNCILGQCFRPGFWDKLFLRYSSGYGRGIAILPIERFLNPYAGVGVFSCPEYRDLWVHEIADRLFGLPVPELIPVSDAEAAACASVAM